PGRVLAADHAVVDAPLNARQKALEIRRRDDRRATELVVRVLVVRVRVLDQRRRDRCRIAIARGFEVTGCPVAFVEVQVLRPYPEVHAAAAAQDLAEPGGRIRAFLQVGTVLIPADELVLLMVPR